MICLWSLWVYLAPLPCQHVLECYFSGPYDPIPCSYDSSHLNTTNQTLRPLLLTAGGQASHVELFYFQALQLTPHGHGVLEEGDSQH